MIVVTLISFLADLLSPGCYTHGNSRFDRLIAGRMALKSHPVNIPVHIVIKGKSAKNVQKTEKYIITINNR
jgi:sulfatase maturation enzyme AslB (radical SAM superfamily)